MINPINRNPVSRTTPANNKRRTVTAGEQKFNDSIRRIEDKPEFQQQHSHPQNQSQQQQAKRTGLSLLDELEKIRLGLLAGGVPQSRLQQLQQLCERDLPGATDPELREILQEIKVRTSVELAKYS